VHVTDESFRAFVAFDVDDASVRRIAKLAARLRESARAPRASWSPVDKMHVTVKFFARIEAHHAAAIGDALASFVAPASAIVAPALAVSAFPSLSRASILIVPIDDPVGRLAAIADAVSAHAESLGYAREARAFKPHVTLARTKAPFNARRWLEAIALDPIDRVTFTALTLYKSVLGSNGSEHTAIARAPLA
jgi:2'-5' RNA ligase